MPLTLTDFAQLLVCFVSPQTGALANKGVVKDLVMFLQ